MEDARGTHSFSRQAAVFFLRGSEMYIDRLAHQIPDQGPRKLALAEDYRFLQAVSRLRIPFLPYVVGDCPDTRIALPFTVEQYLNESQGRLSCYEPSDCVNSRSLLRLNYAPEKPCGINVVPALRKS
jgi:hypothetical protein